MNDLRCINTYLPAESPVLAAQYREPDDLAAIEGWVGVLRDRGLIPAAVRTTLITPDGDAPARLVVSVPVGGGDVREILSLGRYVVFQVGRLRVLDDDIFQARYRPLPNPIASTAAARAELGVQHHEAQP